MGNSMRGIGFLGLTTVLFWLVVGVSVTESLLNRREWWEEEGSSFGGSEKIEVLQPVVAEPDGHWREL